MNQTNPHETLKPSLRSKGKFIGRIALVGALLFAAAAGAYVMFNGNDALDSTPTLFTAQRGELRVTVLEGGSVEALNSQEIRSQVKGREGTKIIYIVDEGYRVTEEDVKNGTVLVELDRSQLEDNLITREIGFQSAEAGYFEEQAEYDIQVNQNQSLIKTAELTAKFALMDLNKYLGESSVSKLLEELNLDDDTTKLLSGEKLTIPDLHLEPPMEEIETSATAERVPIPLDEELMKAIADAMAESGMPVSPDRFRERMARGGEGPPMLTPEMNERMGRMGIDAYEIAERLGKLPKPAPAQRTIEREDMPIELGSTFDEDRPTVDFTRYADLERLEDGEAKQELRKYRDEILVAEDEFKLAQAEFESQSRLAEKDFTTQTELDRARVRVNKAEITVTSAESAERLFIKYTFPKQIEQLVSDYEEALNSLDRTLTNASAELMQQQARLKAAEMQYKIEQSELADLRNQLAATVIRAEMPGLVVYGSSSDSGRYRNQDPIQEGTAVNERQLIITIPDMSQMAVKVKVHESSVQRVAPGQKARIWIDSHPGEALEGEVARVSVLPDSQDRWMNPDMKLYSTDVLISNTPQWLRPGMSAQTEILVEELDDVVYIPLQAVHGERDDQIVYVQTPAGAERRVVKTGIYNDDFIQIIEGVKEGEHVFLRMPNKGQLARSSEAT